MNADVRPPGWHTIEVDDRPVRIYSAGPLVVAEDCPHGFRVGLLAANDCPICSTDPVAQAYQGSRGMTFPQRIDDIFRDLGL